MHADLVKYHSSYVTAFGASAKMKPPSAKSQAFDTTRSAWLGCGVDAVPLRLHWVSSLKVYAVTTDAFTRPAALAPVFFAT
jgi:hypothetical protein